jgi:hypothetical protein
MGAGVLVSIVAVIQCLHYWLCVPLPWPHLCAEQLAAAALSRSQAPDHVNQQAIKTVRETQIIIMLIEASISHLRNGQIITMLID